MKTIKKKKKSFFRLLRERWSKPLSKFWKRIMEWSIGIGTAAVSVVGVDKLFNLQDTYGVSPMVFTVCGYIIVFCAALGLASKITTKNPLEIDNDEELNIN